MTPVTNSSPNHINASPEWLRLPKAGTPCHTSGLSRSTLNRLILPSSANGHTPPVHSVVLKQRFAVRGIRLINRQSLLDFIASAKSATTHPENDAKESIAQLIAQDKYERKMEARWETEPEAPDRPRKRPLSQAAQKCGREAWRKMLREGEGGK